MHDGDEGTSSRGRPRVLQQRDILCLWYAQGGRAAPRYLSRGIRYLGLRTPSCAAGREDPGLENKPVRTDSCKSLAFTMLDQIDSGQRLDFPASPASRLRSLPKRATCRRRGAERHVEGVRDREKSDWSRGMGGMSWVTQRGQILGLSWPGASILCRPVASMPPPGHGAPEKRSWPAPADGGTTGYTADPGTEQQRLAALCGDGGDGDGTGRW